MVSKILAGVRAWRWHGAAASVALMGAGLLVHLWAAARPMWLDEEMIALNLRDRNLAQLAGPLWLGQSAPLGWLALQRAAVLLFGPGEHAMRLVPLLFGIGTILVAVGIGRRWMSPVGAAAFAWLVSFGQWLSLYAVELKPYSADMFWALMLPALAVWAVDPDSGNSRTLNRRALLWWGAAAIGHWFAYGALLVVPACSVVLWVMLWRRAGRRSALVFALAGIGWLASFAAHHALALSDALASEYLRAYWTFALPPAEAGIDGTLRWLGHQFRPFAIKPGGASLWLPFWLAAASGFVVGRSRLGLVLATVPLSAFALAGLRLVPLYERLSLWAVPALYAGIALLIEGTARFGWQAHTRGKQAGVAVALVVGLFSFVVCYDIYWNGREDMRFGRPANSQHQLDDRTAVRWLMAERQPGDVVMTSQLALPAVWWYGGVPITDAAAAGSRLHDGSPILEVGYMEPGLRCRRNELGDALAGRSRVLVYFGFRFDDVPKGFDDLVLDSLAELGTIALDRSFAEVGRVAVVDLRLPPDARRGVPNSRDTRSVDAPRLNGCVAVRLARRW